METNKKTLDNFDGMAADQNPCPELGTDVAHWYKPDDETSNDYYSQQGERYRSMSLESKNDLIKNIVHFMRTIDGDKKEAIINLQLCHWFRTDLNLGIAVAKDLQLDLGEMMKQMPQLF